MQRYYICCAYYNIRWIFIILWNGTDYHNVCIVAKVFNGNLEMGLIGSEKLHE